MPAVNRYYTSTAQDTTLTSSINSTGTSIPVSALTGYPSQYPYIVAIDYNNASEELVQVNSVTGLILSVTRGFNSTSPTSHGVGAVVRHVITAQDMTEAQQHIAAESNVHGVDGTLAGQGDIAAFTFMTMGG
jgi:hypothetical protein